MIEKIRISDLPPYGKTFVGIFAGLAVCMLLWVALIYTVDRGIVHSDRLPAYLNADRAGQGAPTTEDSARNERLEQEEIAEEAEEVAVDSEAVLAPIWDSDLAGREVHADSASAAARFGKVDSTIEAEIARHGVGPGTGYDYNPDREDFDVDEFEQPNLRRNAGLAHTHINGQTLIYFTLGLVFLFTSAAPKIKTTVYWLLGSAVAAHAVGLSGAGFHWFFDDLLAISGLVIVGTAGYMLFWIFADLGKKRATPAGE
ncbi:MAG TPA: hypothetical protein PKM94_02120 [candidate division Zixibacteria bacterium]|nr:hypothetical protein [candidate division Zixibacteria bacterium]HOD65461.1 hypothetical protein [candidate division Zixibacteria bacterium]